MEAYRDFVAGMGGFTAVTGILLLLFVVVIVLLPVVFWKKK